MKFIIAFVLLSLNFNISANYPAATFSSPRDTMNYYLKTMKGYKLGDEKALDLAIKSFDLSVFDEETRIQSGRIAAQKLINTLDRLEYVDVRFIPEDFNNPEWVYQQRQINIDGKLTPVKIALKKNEKGKWLFSAETLSSISAFESSLKDKEIAKGVVELKTWKDYIKERMPEWTAKKSFILLNGQWLGLLAIILLAYIVERIVRLYISSLLFNLLRKKNVDLDEKVNKKFTFPMGVISFTAIFYFLIPLLEMQDEALAVFVRGSRVAFTFAISLGAYQFVDIISLYFFKKAEETENKFDDILVPLINKSAKTFIVAIGIIAVGDSLSLDMKGLLAGMGIAGLGISLAAKDTVANLFGSLTILLDRPFQIGDWVVIDGKIEGVVEEVGLRSCRIRTFYDSLITLPNGGLTNSHIDNYGQRTYRRLSTKIDIEYSTPVEKIEAFRDGIRNLILEHPLTRKDYFHVYLNNMSSSALQIMLYVFWYVPEWSDELRERERLLLDIIKLANKLDVHFAFPTQTVHLEQNN
jgi:MscS family membrane protein